MVKNYQLKNKFVFGFILLGCYPQCGEFEKSIFSVKIRELYYHCRANGQTTIKSIRSFDEQFYQSRHNDITEHKYQYLGRECRRSHMVVPRFLPLRIWFFNQYC